MNEKKELRLGLVARLSWEALDSSKSCELWVHVGAKEGELERHKEI